MADTLDPRFGFTVYGGESSTWPGFSGWNTEHAKVTSKAAIFIEGTFAARPAASIHGRFYFATDTSRIYYDNASTWTELSPVGGAGAPPALSFTGAGIAGVEGTSRVAMRSDARPAQPAWPTQVWDLPRGAGNEIGIPVGDRTVASWTVSGPAGRYQVMMIITARTQSTAADAWSPASLSITLDGTLYAGTWPQDYSRAHQTHTQMWFYNRATAGSFTFALRMNSTLVPLSLDPSSTRLLLTYLGPS